MLDYTVLVVPLDVLMESADTSICVRLHCASGTIRCPDGVCRHEHMC